MRIETYPNGGGEVLHMWYDEIKDMNEADQEKVASEFIEEAFIENEEGYARYCCAIVHNAAAYLPDFLEYLGKEVCNRGVACSLLKLGSLGKTFIASLFHSGLHSGTIFLWKKRCHMSL